MFKIRAPISAKEKILRKQRKLGNSTEIESVEKESNYSNNATKRRNPNISQSYEKKIISKNPLDKLINENKTRLLKEETSEVKKQLVKKPKKVNPPEIRASVVANRKASVDAKHNTTKTESKTDEGLKNRRNDERGDNISRINKKKPQRPTSPLKAKPSDSCRSPKFRPKSSESSRSLKIRPKPAESSRSLNARFSNEKYVTVGEIGERCFNKKKEIWRNKISSDWLNDMDSFIERVKDHKIKQEVFNRKKPRPVIIPNLPTISEDEEYQ